jgi:uncharacterized membrane protein YeaQ/YmgE (transglycosylase-associated protein family)
MWIIGWIVFGLVVGLIARAIMPGKQHMGVIATMLLGIAGSVIGGLVADLFAGQAQGGGMLHGVGWIGSIIGAIGLLAIAAAVKTRPPKTPIERHA